DGQQRLATTAMLLAAIREEYIARSDDRADIIHSNYLADRDLETGAVLPHLTLNSDDDFYFRALVIAKDDDNLPEGSKRSHGYIAGAYSQLREYVRYAADDAGTEWAEKLSSWVSYVNDRVRVIVV